MMNYAVIPGIECPVSRLFFGTAGKAFHHGENCDELLDALYAMGINAFDTARVYGKSEVSLGNWIERRKMQGKVVILSKCGHPDAFWNKRVNAKEMRRDLEESLENLKVDRIDLYLLHRDDPEVPVGEIVEIFNAMHEEGKINLFGGSNWSHRRIEEANQYAKAHHLLPFAASSPYFSLADQKEDQWKGGCQSIAGPSHAEARAWYSRTQMPVISYSSLGNGWFSGQIHPEDRTQARKVLNPDTYRVYGSDENFERLSRAQSLAAKKGCTPAQAALAWMVQQNMNVFPIVSSSSVERMRSNLEALDLSLTAQELDYLDLRDGD